MFPLFHLDFRGSARTNNLCTSSGLSSSCSNIRQEKGTQPKLLGPDILRWGWGLPRAGVGARKFGMSLETKGKQTFCRDIPELPEKFEQQKVCVQFLAPITGKEKRIGAGTNFGSGDSNSGKEDPLGSCSLC